MTKVFYSAVALACAVSFGFAQAGPVRGHSGASLEADSNSVLDTMDSLRSALTAEQVGSLSMIRGDGLVELRNQLDSILTPAQMKTFESALSAGGVDEAYPQDPGLYLPYGCWTASKGALGFSLVGYIGCPGAVAKDATVAAWASSNFSGVCLIDGTESCPAAVESSDHSAQAWETLLGSCSVADTAYYTALMTYRSCGGPKGGDDTPLPTPTPPEPTPSFGEPSPTELPPPGTPPSN